LDDKNIEKVKNTLHNLFDIFLKSKWVFRS